MKSKVISYPDFRTLDPGAERLKVVHTDQAAAIDEALQRIAKKYAVKGLRTPSEAIESDDLVKFDIRCTGDCPDKYNRQGLSVKVGKGFYDKDVEAALIGRRPEESFTLELGGRILTLHVISAEYLKIGEVTEEQFKAENIEGAGSIEEYKAMMAENQLFEENLEHYMKEVLPFVRDSLIQGAVFEIDEDEYQERKAYWLHDLKESAEEEGHDPRALMCRLTGCPETASDEELDAAMDDFMRREFKMLLILEAIARDNTLADEPSREQYDALVEEAVAAGYDRETVLANNTYEAYCESMIQGAANNLLLEHFMGMFTE